MVKRLADHILSLKVEWDIKSSWYISR